ncbi:hypothetical protein GRX01_00355 [Halobaculum sp. WSA2]|uniref:Histidine kinase-, DNA gyrase B-, and HSP90-like ATPase n=1 Tax=Halobaculum saliterrae TaxID=2073113 RepID=A0A6B0ST06_9EURY|nr:ATP-binding protein [Halobaculum saliterrae]MXR39813.1 hypothetical protein [Halobaculum saliterrae]
MSEDSSTDLAMRFDLNVLKHLGLRMYTNLPAVVSEYVANAWDAWATEVSIEMPQDESMSPDYQIVVEDDGQGMTRQEVNNEFLVVGRNRRSDEDKDYVERDDGSRRKVMGRKGIGKLAGFGVADIVRIRTVKDGEFVEFVLDYGEMQNQAKQGEDTTTTYHPKIVDEGVTNEDSGTRVVLTEFDRTQRPVARYVRERLARKFSVIGDEFVVRINEDEVTGDERNLKDRCEFKTTFDDETINDEGHQISGWIGTLPKPTPDDIEGGVAVMARGKIAQKPITFGVAEGGTRGQMALQYLVGEIHADFLDDEEDLIATHRSEVMWNKYPANSLQEFIVAEIKDICSQWPKRRREEQMEELRSEESYNKHIDPLDDREREIADDFLAELAEKGDYEDDTLDDMAAYVSSGVQQRSFQELLREIESSDISNTDKLVKLFDQYEVLDAMNSLRIVRGRFQAIQKFEELIEESDSNLQDLHGFVSDNPWLIDPRWDYLDEELDIREEIKRNYPNVDRESRVGFISLGDADTIRLVDIRQTDHTIDKNDLDEFKDYVDFLRSIQNMDPVNGRDIEGYIVAQGSEETRQVNQEIRRMKMDDMRLRTYGDIKEIARRSHQAFIDVFERKAKRTESQMLQSYLSESEQSGLHDFVTGQI